jgi:RHS repeat-associated protein
MYPHGAHTKASGELVHAYDGDGFSYDVVGRVPFSVVFRNQYEFTGKERDSESGLDYFIHRHYASTMGRFMQPDPAGMMAVDIRSPQTLNRYAYVLNNPLSFTDPFGLDCAYLNSSGTGVEKGGIDQHSSSGECAKTGGYWVEGSVTNVSIGGDAETVSLTGTTNGNTNNTSASYQQNATFDVGEYHNTFANPFNHIALGLHGGTLFGQNPRSDRQFAWQIFAHNPGNVVVPGEIKPQVGGQLLDMVHIPVTGMPAQVMQDAISQSQQNPPPYSIGDHGGRVCDCASWAQQILGDAGINSGLVTRSPDVLMQQLHQEQSPNQ